MHEFERPASEWMVTPVYTVREGAPLAMAAKLFDELGVSALPVLDASSRLTGLIGKQELVRAGRLRPGSKYGEPVLWLPERPVVQFMRTSVPVVRRNLPLSACAARMLSQDTRRLYVAEDGPLEGVLSTREMMRAVARARVEVPLRELARPSPTLEDSAPLSSASAQLASTPREWLAITRQGVSVGVFSGRERRNSVEASPAEPVATWMEKDVVALAADTLAYEAAEAAVQSGASYVVAHDARSGEYRVISGLSFARIVSGAGT